MSNPTTPATETILVRTRTGAKLHRGGTGSVMSWCGIRAAVRVPVASLTVASLPHLCGHCFGMGAPIAIAVSTFLRDAARLGAGQ